MINASLSWVDLRENSPIDISRLVGYAQDFNSLVGVRISIHNLNKAKRALLEARGNFDLMITTLQQLLYDRTILKQREDEVLYFWLVDNLGRYLKIVDEKERELVIDYDRPYDEKSNRVGISSLSAYSKILKTSTQSIIYESLLKAIKEYNGFEETGDLKREPRTFLYILFHILQVTLSALGGLTREKTLGFKKGSATTYPTQWQTLMSKTGQKTIRERHKEETGEEIKVPLELIDNDGNSVTVIESDEDEEDEDGSD